MTRVAKYTVSVTYNEEEIPNAERLEHVISHEIYNIDGIHSWAFDVISDVETEEVDD